MTGGSDPEHPDSPGTTDRADALEPGEDTPDEPTGQAVTIRVEHRVNPERVADYEAFLAELAEAAAGFPGYLSTRVFRPPRGGRDYRMVVRFDSADSRREFEESPEGRAVIVRGAAIAAAPIMIQDITGTGQERRLALAISPLDDFVRTSVSGIGLLLLGTVVALIMVNSPLAERYEEFWATELSIGLGDFGITLSLRHWVSDGLMALFFFVVGLEIKREVLVGEMRYPRQAALPIAAAIGGAVVPALVFLAFNAGSDGSRGWGIAMATDTAFSLGVLSLLGGRVRPLLLVFLTAFAIVDDIVAVLVIALFYTESIVWPALGAATVLLGLLVVANRAGFYGWPIYAAGGVLVWLAIFESGVHATVAGVLVAMTVPARSWINPSEFLLRGRRAMDAFEAACSITPNMLSNEPQQRATQELERLTEDVETPMTHLQHSVNPWVAFGILPLFAFANAGIPLVDGLGDALTSTVTWGVIAGLVVGKPVGITLFAWLAVTLGIAIKPRAIAWRHVLGVALLGGIGFTISLFITELAFEAGPVANAARIGILFGSLTAGLIGFLVLRSVLPPPREREPATV